MMILVAVTLAPTIADEVQGRLREDLATLRAIWLQVVGKPLQYDRIPPADLSDLIGRWRGFYLGPGARPELVLTLEKDGTWTSRIEGPGRSEEAMAESSERGCWYALDGCLLLYDGAPIQEAEVSSVLFMRDDELRLMAVPMEAGYVALRKEEGPDGPATAD